MKSFFVFCVLKIITALAQKTNADIPEKHEPITYFDSFIFNGDRDIPYLIRSTNNQNYNNINSQQENKIEGHKIINENDMPQNYIEVANYDPADVSRPDIGPARRSSNSNSGVNINNNVSDNKDVVEVNNIQQENKNFDSQLKANFIELLNSYINPTDRKTESHNLSQEHAENRASSNANNDVNINNNVNNNMQKVVVNNIQQKNELNRRRMNINSKLNAKLFNKNIGNSFLEANEESQTSVINSLPLNVNNKWYKNLNFDNKNVDKIEHGNIGQNNKQNRWNMGLLSNRVNENSVINSNPSQESTKRRVNLNVNSGININNDIYDNLNKVQLDNIQQSNKGNRKRLYTQSTLYRDLSKENEQEMDLLALLSPEKKSLENFKMNINKKLNINNNLNHNVQQVVISNVNQKNMETIKKMNVQSILNYFSYFIHHPPKDKDLNALKLKKETYMTMLKYFIKYLGEMGVPDSEIVYYIQQAQSYETDAEIREKYNKLIHSYQTSNQNSDIDGVLSENPVTVIPVEDEGIIRDENLQFLLSKFNYFLHNAPKDENLSALKQKRKIYLLELVEYIKYLEAIGVPDFQIVWYLTEAQKYESDEELRAIYTQTIDSYKNAIPNGQQSQKIEVQLNKIILSILGIDGDINAISSTESTKNIHPSIINNINIHNNKHHNIQNIHNNHLHERNYIQFLLNYFNYFLHHAPKDNNLDVLQNKRKHYLLELFELVKYLKASGISKLNILQYLQDALKYESDLKLKELYWKLIHSYTDQPTGGNEELSPPSEEILPNNSSEIIENESGNEESSSSEEILPNNTSGEKSNESGNEEPSPPSEEILPNNSAEEKDNESAKEVTSPPSDIILPNNSTENIENEPGNEESTPNTSSEEILPDNSTEEIKSTDKNTEPPSHDETTPQWEPENTPLPDVASEGTLSPHLVPKNTPLPYWIPETTLLPDWESESTASPHLAPETTPQPNRVPENEPKQPCIEIDKSTTDLMPFDEVISPNILDFLKHPYTVYHYKYMENILTNLILHLKDKGVPDQEIQKIVQMSLINVISSMAQHSIRECQEKILREIRYNLQLSLYKYLLHKCHHSMR